MERFRVQACRWTVWEVFKGFDMIRGELYRNGIGDPERLV
jgi:hypothetical protein